MLNDVFVGCIGCRLEPREDGKQDLYVMTLSVLAPYRRLGIGKPSTLSIFNILVIIFDRITGKKLLQSVLDSLGKHPNIARVYLHVWVSNPTALAFYDKFAFTNCGIVPDYYKKITPPDAVLLEKIVAPPAAATAAAVVMKP